MTRTFNVLNLVTPIMVAGLLVSACGDQASTGAAPVAEATPTSTLAKVDLTQPLRVLGNEPFWSLDINPSALTFTPMDGPKHIADNPSPVLLNQTATWSTKTQAGIALEVILTAKDCSDGMSDRTYPLSATVKIGQDTYSGCAASLKALEAAKESGRVE